MLNVQVVLGKKWIRITKNAVSEFCDIRKYIYIGAYYIFSIAALHNSSVGLFLQT